MWYASQTGFNCDGNKLPVWQNECDLHRFLPFWCQLRSCPRPSNSSMYGQVLLNPGGIAFTEITRSGISTLAFLANKGIITLKWVLSQQWTLYAYWFTPKNIEVPEESLDALGTSVLRNRPCFQTLQWETKGEKVNKRWSALFRDFRRKMM